MFDIDKLQKNPFSLKPTKTKKQSKVGSTVTYEMLSDEQRQALVKVKDFINSDDRQMVFGGYAGTGKTTVTRFILDDLDQTTLNTICTAPTNEAVRVIASQTGRDYDMTIYSILGLALVQDGDSTPYIAPMGECKIKDYDVIIVDECSMITTLLYLMIENMLNQFSHCKIIYIGDPAQLPPVNDPNGFSPVFNIDPSKWAFLTQVQRTAADNPIISLATLVRQNIESPFDPFNRITIYNEETKMGVQVIEDETAFMSEMFSLFNSTEFKNDPNHIRALAYTNATVNILNTKIRQHIYGAMVPEYIADEIVLVDEPIMEPHGKVVRYTVGERLLIEKAELLEDEDLGIKYWSLRVVNYQAPKFAQTKSHINIVQKNYLESYRKKLSDLAVKCKVAVAEIGNKAKAWKPYYSMKNKFSYVKYIYAITIHTSQGSTFKNVFVDNNDMNKLRRNHVERNKLKYVAFTRASHRLVIN